MPENDDIRVRELTAHELADLRREIHESSSMMRTELRRRRAVQVQDALDQLPSLVSKDCEQ